MTDSVMEIVWDGTKAAPGGKYLAISSEQSLMNADAHASAKRKGPLVEFEESAVMGAQAVRRFLSGDGGDDALAMAKVGVLVMGAYTSLRSTVVKEMALRAALNPQDANK